MTTLTWLHISDLHCGMKDHGYWASAKKALIDDIKRVGEKLGPIDAIIFTGDLAFSGEKAQYDDVDHVLALIIEALGQSKKPEVLAVPGNHDLKRTTMNSRLARGLQEGDGLEPLWDARPNKSDPELIDTVRKWLAEYDVWWERTRGNLSGNYCAGLLPGDFSYVLHKDGQRIGFVGLNAAFLDVSDDIKHVATDIRQLHTACGGDLPTWADQNAVNFLLTHHPPACFLPATKAKYNETLAPSFFAHLCGHLHDSRNEETRYGAGTPRRIWQATSLFGIEHCKDEKGTQLDRRYGYSIGRITFDANGFSYEVWHRQGVRRQDGEWHLTVDTSYALKDDLIATAADPIKSARGNGAPTVLPVPAVPAVAPTAAKRWPDAAAEATLWLKARGATPERLETLQASARKVAEACAACVAEAQKALPDDPWYDEDFPRRVLTHLATIAPSEGLGAEETLLLVISPFLREGIYAAGKGWMAKANPFDLASQGRAQEPRNTLEQIHRARPDLVRLAERLEGEEQRAVCLWLVARALQRSPDLWRRKPGVPTNTIVDALEAMIQASVAVRGMNVALLFALARCVGANPDLLASEGGIESQGNLEQGDIRIRPAPLGYLLSAAGCMALDPRMVDEVAVDHVGRDKAFTPGHVREALQRAVWAENDKRYVLTHECGHPVIDFVLRELVSQADQAIERIRDTRDAHGEPFLSALRNLPVRLVADRVTAAKEADGRRTYRLPHVRFQLEHTQVRELLTGEQLYGDPTVAIRELYQNALDACRYRRSRQMYLLERDDSDEQPYEGSIVFRQGFDDRGRPFIECEDNGVGMTAHLVERVFSVAGRRFHDMDDFIEERAAWGRLKNSKIDFVPNSQFGIGVLSYFMLADEVRVETRRYNRDGTPDNNALIVSISSASGLFRLEDGAKECMPGGGTKVRLYLAKTTYVPKDERIEKAISCRNTLTDWLWIAEFDTVVEEEGKPALHYPAGKLAPNGKLAEDCVATTDPDVWWRNPDLNRFDHRKNPVLVDGLRVEDEHDLVLVNLCGSRRPKLSVDRRKIQSWDASWVTPVLEKSWEELVGWRRLTVEFLWRLEDTSVRCARNLFSALEAKDARLPLKDPSAHGESALRLREAGCCKWDENVVNPHHGPSPLHLLEALRIETLERCGIVCQTPVSKPVPANWRDVSPRLEPGDEPFIDAALDGDRIGALDILSISVSQGEPVRQVLDRADAFTRCGLDLDINGEQRKRLAEIDFNTEHRMLLSDKLDGSPYFVSSLSIGHIAEAMRKFDWTFDRVAEMVEQLSPVGIEIPFDIKILKLVLEGEDIKNAASPLMRVLCAPHVARLKGEVSRIDILEIALETKLQPADVVFALKRLAPMGITVSDSVEHAATAVNVDENDRKFLAENVFAGSTLQILAAPILQLARDKGVAPKDIVERLERYAPLGVEVVPSKDALDKARLDDIDWKLLSRNLGGDSRWIPSTISLRHALRASRTLSIPPADMMRRLNTLSALGYRLGFAKDELEGLSLSDVARLPENILHGWQSPFDWLLGEADPTHFQRHVEQFSRVGAISSKAAAQLAQLENPAAEAELILLRVMADQWDTPETFRKRVAKRAPLYYWWLSADELAQRIERLAPIVEAVMASEES